MEVVIIILVLNVINFTGLGLVVTAESTQVGLCFPRVFLLAELLRVLSLDPESIYRRKGSIAYLIMQTCSLSRKADGCTVISLALLCCLNSVVGLLNS